MASGFQYRSGPWDLALRGTTASTAIAPLDALGTTTGLTLPLATGSKCTGVALDTKLVGDAATTRQQLLKTSGGRTRFLAEAKAGTLVATEVDALFNVSGASGAMGIAADTSTNNDLYIDTVLSTGATGQALIKFADPSYLHATN